MRKTYIVTILLVFACVIFTQSCGKSSFKTSHHGENKSHYPGGMCLSCHLPGGAAKEAFTVSGTVFDEVRLDIRKKAVVKLYTKPKGQGKLIATLRTDDLGNFYTTQKIDFSQGLYPTLLGTPGVKEDTKHMPRRIFYGDCNSCHGLYTENLGID